MAEEVEIIGVDGGPASEATLQKLLAAMETASSPDGTSRKVQEKYNEAKEQGTKVVKDFADEIEDTTSIVEDFGSGVASAAAGVMSMGTAVLNFAGSVLQGVADTVFNFADELISGGNKISDFAQHFPMIGTLLAPLAGFFESTLDSFRELSNVGAGFNNNLLELRSASAAAGLSLDQFSGMIANNSNMLTFLGGTATQGAKQLADLTKNIRNGEIGENLMNLGFTMESLNEHTAGYIELQARRGRLEGMTQAELVAGTQGYMMQLDKLAKVTGKSREQVEEALKQQAAEANVRAMAARLQGEELERFQEGVAFIDAQLGDSPIAAALKDMADGVAQTDLAKRMQALTPAVGNLMERFGRGEVGLEELQQGLKQSSGDLVKFFDGMDATQVQAMMQGPFGELLAEVGLLSEVANRANIDVEKMEEEQAQRDKITSTFATFEQAIQNIKSAFLGAFIDSGVLGDVGIGLTDLTDFAKDAGQGLADLTKDFLTSDSFKNGYTSLKNWVTSINFDDIATSMGSFGESLSSAYNYVADFITEIQKIGIQSAFEKYILMPLQNAMGDIPGLIKRLLFGESSGDKKERLASQKQALQSQLKPGVDPDKAVQLTKQIAELDKEMQNASDTTGMLGEVFTDIPWGGIALGIGLVIGAVAAAGFAATAAAPGLTAIGAALAGIGVAAGGIGVLLFGISSVMDSVGENAEEVGHIIDRVFAGIQGTIESVLGEIKGIVGTVFEGIQGTIESVGIAIERVFDSIGGAVAAPIEAIGGVIDKYRELKEAGKDNSAENIALLADIPAGRISGIADEILTLNESLAGIDSGFSFGAMLGGDEFSSQVQALAGLGKLGDVDFKVTADGVKDLVEFTENLDDAALRRYTEQMENLVEVLGDLNEELSKDNNGTFTSGTGENAGSVLSSLGGMGSGDKIDDLNKTMKQILSVLQEQYGVNKKTFKETRKQSGNVF